MPTVKASLQITAPIERAWGSATDGVPSPSYPPGTRIERVPPGPPHPSQLLRIVMPTAQGEQIAETVVTAVDAPRSMTTVGNVMFLGKVPFRVTESLVLEPSGDGVHATARLHIGVPNPIAWTIAWLGKPLFRGLIERQLRELRAKAEKAAPTGAD